MFGLLASFAKLPALSKMMMLGAVILGSAAIAGLPLHDFWFLYALFMVASSIVSGMPEPDTKLTGWRFFYTWVYRSGHLLVASGTAYFMHQKNWSQIGTGPVIDGEKPDVTVKP